MPLPARAALLIACLASLPARAFVRTATADGSHFLWWPTRSVGFVIQEDCALRPPPDQLPAAAEDAGESTEEYLANCEAAVKASFLAWQNAGGQGCTDLQLPYQGDTPIREVGYDPSSSSNMNSVLFQPALCDNVIPLTDPCWAAGDCDTADPDNPCFGRGDTVIALTTTTYQPVDGTLLDADIEINDAPGAFDFSAEQPGDPLPGTTDVENTVTHEAGHFIGLAQGGAGDGQIR